MHCGKTFINTGHRANREYFLPCPSPQLRMSFIVFSTEGRILMSLTEDRWVQIPLERLLIPLFSIMQQNWTQLTHSCDPWGFFFFLKIFPADILLFYSLSIVLDWTSAPYGCFCGQLMCLIFPQPTFSSATKSFHRPPATLRYLILQRTHFLSHCVTVS